MPTIVPNQTFKHGTETYEEGESYEVSEGEAYYFQQVGWVGPRTVNDATVTLNVHDVQIKSGTEVK